MRTRIVIPLLSACVAAAIAAGGCALTGRREAPLECRDEHLACAPFGASAPGCELTGKVRIELPRYRLRGLCRIVHAEGGRLRIDFEHSSLFGAIERRFTIFAGDDLAILDADDGSWVAGDSALAAVAEALGDRVSADEILYALLLASPRCAEMDDPHLTRRGSELVLRGSWRGRLIELRCDEREGVRQFRQRFISSGRRYLLEYEYRGGRGAPNYPRFIRFSREGGSERISMEIIEMKQVEPDSAEFFIGLRRWKEGTSRAPGCIIA